jgi:hypothetical protein
MRISSEVRAQLRALAHARNVRPADLVGEWLHGLVRGDALPVVSSVDTGTAVQFTLRLPPDLLVRARARAAHLGLSLTQVVRMHVAAAKELTTEAQEHLTDDEKALIELGLDPRDPLLVAARQRLQGADKTRPGRVITEAVRLFLRTNPSSARHLPHGFRLALLQDFEMASTLERAVTLEDIAEALIRVDPSISYGALALLLATIDPDLWVLESVKEMQKRGDNSLIYVAERLVQVGCVLWRLASRDPLLDHWFTDQFALVAGVGFQGADRSTRRRSRKPSGEPF